MTEQCSERSAMSNRQTLSPPDPMSYLRGLALKIWTSFWMKRRLRRNAPMVQSRQPLTYRFMESMGLGGPRWHGSGWQRGIAESGRSRLSILMIDIPGDLVWELPCVQQASYLEEGVGGGGGGGHWSGCCPCTCTLIKNPMMMMMMMMMMISILGKKFSRRSQIIDFDISSTYLLETFCI